MAFVATRATVEANFTAKGELGISFAASDPSACPSTKAIAVDGLAAAGRADKPSVITSLNNEQGHPSSDKDRAGHSIEACVSHQEERQEAER